MEQRLTGLEPTFRAWKVGSWEPGARGIALRVFRGLTPNPSLLKPSARVLLTQKSEPESPGFIEIHTGSLIQQ